MGKLDEFKLWYTCKKNGEQKEYKEYKDCVKRLEVDINRYTNYLNQANQRFIEVQKKFPKESTQYIDARDEMNRWKHTLDSRQLELKFIRPNSKEDIEYRNSQLVNFVDKLQECTSINLDLRFHGTPIYFAEQIIKTKSISSTADRYDDYIKSTDMRGEISASSINTLNRTINFFSDMTSYNSCLPAGCIFAIFPKDKEDATYGHDLLHSVDFEKKPEQLFGIFTTPENIDKVKKWMQEAELNPNCVYTFEGFLQAVEEKSASIDEENGISKVAENQDNEEVEINIKELAKNALEKGITNHEVSNADENEIKLNEYTKDNYQEGIDLGEQ